MENISEEELHEARVKAALAAMPAEEEIEVIAA